MPGEHHLVNVIVCDKQKHLQYLDMDAAIKHCAKDIGIREWASNDAGSEPDVVMACAGDVINRVPELCVAGAHVKQKLRDMQIDCRDYAHEHGVDQPEADAWVWPY